MTLLLHPFIVTEYMTAWLCGLSAEGMSPFIVMYSIATEVATVTRLNHSYVVCFKFYYENYMNSHDSQSNYTA